MKAYFVHVDIPLQITDECFTRSGECIQESEIRVPMPGLPENFDGGKITGTNDFTCFAGKSYGPGGRKKNEKMPSSQYRYEV